MSDVGNLIYGVTLQMDVRVDLRAKNYKYFCLFNTLNSLKSQVSMSRFCALWESGRAYNSTDSWKLSIFISDWLKFCCENLILHQKKRNENNKNKIFIMKNKKKAPSNIFYDLTPLTRDVICSKL